MLRALCLLGSLILFEISPLLARLRVTSGSPALAGGPFHGRHQSLLRSNIGGLFSPWPPMRNVRWRPIAPVRKRRHLDLAFDLVFVARRGFEREVDVLPVRRRLVWDLPFATFPLGSSGRPAASLSFLAISAISSGA